MSSKTGSKRDGRQEAKQNDQPAGPIVCKNFIDKGRLYRKGQVYVIGSGGAKRAEQLKAQKLIA
jgi:hypothetical protein